MTLLQVGKMQQEIIMTAQESKEQTPKLHCCRTLLSQKRSRKKQRRRRDVVGDVVDVAAGMKPKKPKNRRWRRLREEMSLTATSL